MTNKLKALYAAGILTPSGIVRLSGALFRSGTNLMALLRFASRHYTTSTAVEDEHEAVTYERLFERCYQIALTLHRNFELSTGSRIAIICRNHIDMVRALFAASGTGADVFMLNADMSYPQLEAILQRQSFNLIVADEEHAGRLSDGQYYHQCINAASLRNLSTRSVDVMPFTTGGNIVMLSGGTTGDFKTIRRKPGVLQFLNPLCSLLEHARLAEYGSVYVATPIYHGYGMASLLMSLLLGSRIHLRRRFDAASACVLLRQHDIDVITVVPVMLRRMLALEPYALCEVECIVSGSAPLDAGLATETLKICGPKLFNLYGTSEAGFCMMANPAELAVEPASIGKPITGTEVRILDGHGQDVKTGVVGSLCVRTEWAAGKNAGWIDTSDLCYVDSNGFYFLCGRADDMIVSGGENVYPIVVERELLKHTEISEAVAIAVRDEEFGQRLEAYVVLKNGSALSDGDVINWLSGRVARFQMPRAVHVVDELPYTPVGKPDKKALSGLRNNKV